MSLCFNRSQLHGSHRVNPWNLLSSASTELHWLVNIGIPSLDGDSRTKQSSNSFHKSTNHHFLQLLPGFFCHGTCLITSSLGKLPSGGIGWDGLVRLGVGGFIFLLSCLAPELSFLYCLEHI